jgi:digeranylgeranylglycerophospholipid reductase
MSVVCLEKDREVGLPVRCAEGVAASTLAGLVPVRPAWIAREVHGAKLVAPDGTVVESIPGEKGYVLHRKVFDADLAAMAAEAGAEVLTKAYVRGLVVERGRVCGVQVERLGKTHTLRASVVIGADGVESRVGRWAGLDTHTPPDDIAACVQMTLAGIDIRSDMAEFYFGGDVAPGGYAWVFPKGEGTANVGLGIPRRFNRSRKAIDYLTAFVESRFPKASVLTLVAGSVPLVPLACDFVADGLMLAGDAAHHASPISGGGICNALIAGQLAGEVAADCIRAGDVSKRSLMRYQKAWMKKEGNINKRLFKIKKVLFELSDQELNKIAATLLDLSPSQRTAFQIIKTGIIRHPKLVVDLAKSVF